MKPRNYLNILITTAILILFGYIFYNFDYWEQIKKIQPIYLLVISILIILSVYINGIFLRIIAGSFKIDLREHFLISLSSSLLNLIIPFKGGLAIRAAYLKKKYGYSYSDFAASIFGNYIILFLVASILALFLLLLVYFLYGIFNFWFLTIFVVILAGMMILINCRISLKGKSILLCKINSVITGWKIIAEDKKVILKLSVNTLIAFVIQALIIKHTFMGLGFETTFIKSLFITVMSLLGVFINITPGSLGMTEVLFIISGKGLGIDPAESFLVALVIRAINTLIIVILGTMANMILMKRSRMIS